MLSETLKIAEDLLLRKPQFAVSALILITVFGFVSGVRYLAHEARVQAAYDTAKSFENSITALHQYYSKIIEPRARAAGVEFSVDFSDYPDRLPFPATVSIEFGDTLQNVNPELSTKIFSKFPFPNREDRTLDAFEMEALAFLNDNPALDFFRIESRNGRDFARYARAMIMKEDCVACHNREQFGFQGRWAPGDFRGARQVTLPIPNLTPYIDRATIPTIALAIASSLLGGFLVWPIVRHLRTTLSLKEVLISKIGHKNRQLERIGQDKDMLFSIVGHDLRAPLSGIKSATEWMSHQGPSMSKKEMLEYAAIMNSESEAILNQLDNILKWSNTQLAGIDPQPETLDLADLIDECLVSVAQSSRQKSIAVVRDVEATSGHADREMVRLVLRNFLTNAVKFTPQGGEICIQTSKSDDQVLLSVKDNGIGMTPDVVDTLLSEAPNVSRPGTNGEKGTGLGLMLCRQMIERNHGTLKIHSEPGEGTLCTFTIPLS